MCITVFVKPPKTCYRTHFFSIFEERLNKNGRKVGSFKFPTIFQLPVNFLWQNGVISPKCVTCSHFRFILRFVVSKLERNRFSRVSKNAIPITWLKIVRCETFGQAIWRNFQKSTDPCAFLIRKVTLFFLIRNSLHGKLFSDSNTAAQATSTTEPYS